ncbi:MAG: hypothetical protein AB7N76_08985 [Planctomycetota bacterium]
MAHQLTPALAVEKVLYRLALHLEGAVPIARAFLELPFSLEEIEEHADKAADGRSVVRNEWGEFLCYEFPELMQQMPKAPDDCPTCFGAAPAPFSEGGVEQRRAMVCEACYRALRKQHRSEPNETMMGKLAHFFRGEEESEDLVEVARIEHEIFYLGLRAELEQFTHTTIAAQSRRPAEQIKERLDRMAARRYIRMGLLPSGDAVAYSFPPDLSYPRQHFERMEGQQRASGRVAGGVRLEVDDGPAEEVQPFQPNQPNTSSPKVTATPRTPPKPPLKITIKSRRDRPTQ